jgi:hypothetical protein
MQVIYWIVYTWVTIVFAPWVYTFQALDAFIEGYGKYALMRKRERDREARSCK